MVKLTSIVAATEGGIIGDRGGIPWNLPDDMKFFKDTTTGSVVITGRVNYLSIPEKYRPLKGRYNIILSKSGYLLEGTDDGAVAVVDGVVPALTKIRRLGRDSAFVIGGGIIYKAFEPYVDRVLLTVVHADIPGDTGFDLDSIRGWNLVSERHHPVDDRHAYAFTFKEFARP